MTVLARLRRPNEQHSDDDVELFELIRTRSFRQGSFKLSSGVTSPLYFNLKPTMMDPRGAYLSAMAFLKRIRAANVDFVGGLEMGAVPIIGSLAAISELEEHPVRTFFVRKQPKTHGTMDLVEGLAPNESLANMRVLIVDDVATTGSSMLKAINVARAVGATVEAALVLVDREEGATERLASDRVRLMSVFQGRQFLGS